MSEASGRTKQRVARRLYALSRWTVSKPGAIIGVGTDTFRTLPRLRFAGAIEHRKASSLEPPNTTTTAPSGRAIGIKVPNP